MFDMIKLSYMTFVCPDWEITKVVSFAKAAGYDGVELRVDSDHRHGINSESPDDVRRRVRCLFEEHGVEVACIATSGGFAFPELEGLRERVEKAKANLQLAADLGAPVVRIFAGGTVPELNDDVADRVAACFDEVGEFAEPLGICPMLECGHDIIKGADEAHEVIRRVNTRNFGALWNRSVMDDHTFDILKDRLRHVHVHKEVLDPQNDNILHLAGRLKSINYDGYISLEIIEEKNLPEDVLRETATRLKGYINRA